MPALPAAPPPRRAPRTAAARALAAGLACLACLAWLPVACTEGEPAIAGPTPATDSPYERIGTPGDLTHVLTAPDGVFRQDTFEDFNAGTAGGSGADLFLSANGKVLPQHVLDIDRDGWPDLPIACHGLDGTLKVDSWFYLGGPDGYSTDRRVELPSNGAWSIIITDFDVDGHLDILIVGMGDMTITEMSFLYWGGPDGFDRDRRTEIPTESAHGVSAGDLDRDGWLDLVIAQRMRDYSIVFWGGPEGYSADRQLQLPTTAANTSALADLDKDGWLDVVLTNVLSNKPSEAGESYIYWGSGHGPDAERRTALPNEGGHGVSVADVDADGWLDILWSSWREGITFRTTSVLYYGGPDGFDPARNVGLPTLGPQSNSIFDLNGDGWLDIAFANSNDGQTNHLDSTIYYGSAQGFLSNAVGGLPSVSAHGHLVADFDLDGLPDILLTNHNSTSERGVGLDFESNVYWGSADGFDAARRTTVPTQGAHQGVMRDPGNIYDRRELYHYDSPVFDAGGPAVSATLEWTAEVPARTSLSFLVRSADSVEDLAHAVWSGPDGPMKGLYTGTGAAVTLAQSGQRYWQYRAIFKRDAALYGPVLDAVTLRLATE